MNLHPILNEKLSSALLPLENKTLTRRDALLPQLPDKVHAVIGMRRAGKTSFLHQLQVEKRRGEASEQSLYISFDDERLSDIDAGQLSLLLEELYRRFPGLRGQRKVTWYLDEIQLVPGWDRFVRRVMDSEAVEIVVSGSSARMLSREVHTSLRGRGLATVIRPFGFREFLRHRGEEPEVEARRWTAARRSLIENRFAEFLRVGGFPEAQGVRPADRLQLLQGYVDTVLFRDIVERYAVSQVAALRWLVRQALRNPAGSFSVHRLAQDLRSQGLGVGKEILAELLGHLMDAFLLSAVPVASESLRRQNSNPRKLYPADPGLIGAFDTGSRSNLGRALETVVYNELERRGAEVAYVKTASGFEVDFLARTAAGPQQLVQVCADLSQESTRRRELRALEEAGREFPDAQHLLLVADGESARALEPAGVRVLPVYEWLLEPSPPD